LVSEALSEATDQIGTIEINRLNKEKSITSRANQENPIINIGSGHIHPDRESQVDYTVQRDFRSVDSNSKSGKAILIIEKAKQFNSYSWGERKALSKRKPDLLTCTRSGKIPIKPLTKKQQNRLQAIPQDTLSAYLLKE